MLTRAAQRRQAFRHLETAAEQIQLPWLCPALARSQVATEQRRHAATRPGLPRAHTSPSNLRQPAVVAPQLRRLASAARVHDNFDGGDEYLPFAYERHGPPLYTSDVSPLKFDLSKIVMIDDTTTQAEERSHAHGAVRGSSSEIEATLEACLQVQRWDRAVTLLRQLQRPYSTSPSKLQQAYNRVLEAMVFDLIWNNNTQLASRINKWIEVEMRQAGVDPDAHTFALKIKAALASLEGSKRDRTVRRYWEMAQEYEYQNEVASLRNILSDRDLGKLTEICNLSVRADPEFAALEDMDNHGGEGTSSVVAGTAAPDLRPTIRETKQKGLGLVSLRKSLISFAGQEPPSQVQAEQVSPEERRQVQLEQDSLKTALARWQAEHEKRAKIGVSTNFGQGRIGALLWDWHKDMIGRIEKELILVDQAEAADKKTSNDQLRCEYGPFLRLLAPEKMAALTPLIILQQMSKHGMSNTLRIAQIVTEVGRAMESEIEAERIQSQKNMAKGKKSSKSKGNTVQGDSNLQNSAGESVRLHTSTISDRGMYWNIITRGKVGAILCEMLFDVAKLDMTKKDPESGKTFTLAQPVFHHEMTYKNGRKVGTVSLLPDFATLLARQPSADLIAKQLPMVCKPRPWTGFRQGGYLETKQPVLRVKFADQAQKDYARMAADRGDLDTMFAGLDVLSSTAWKINKNVFDVMLEAWNSGEAVANLPPLNKVFPEIPKPGEDASQMEKFQYFTKIRAIENERGGLHSNRCFQNFQMEIAKSYLGETFYLPHNVDFRGRAYPIPPYLNQMGADNSRGLLLFAEGRELGSEGLKWLQVHLANVFGYDKASLRDRASFAVDHLEDIRDSVANPLGGKRWWLKAEDPWQCLATCHELLGAFALPDPAKYVSHLPVHQDGTCNGLQHYAALGGDVAGAKQVNLEPGDKPADVYTGVAEMVKAEIKSDAAAGLEIAKLLDGRITRKIVKQTVMTNVYGVTFTGAMKQVKRQIDAILPDLTASGHGGSAAIYVARKIFMSLGTLFEGAHDIQYWLGDCAQRITHSISPAQLKEIVKSEAESTGPSKKTKKKSEKSGAKAKVGQDNRIDSSSFRSTLVWTTPIKLPVVQPYRKTRSRKIQTSLQNLALAEPNPTDSVDHRKQLQAFPPNFIHSLDATHMMLSALQAKERGLTFSAVHDSFWTHAADIGSLNTLLRDAFIRMHSEDIIGRLAAEFGARYKDHVYLAKLSSSTPVAKKILKYRKGIVSASPEEQHKELVREVKRRQLLASQNPDERAEGEGMVTAASIFEKYGGEKYLHSKVSLGHTAVGEVPEIDPASVAQALNAADVSHDVDLGNTLEPLMEADAHPESNDESKSKRRRRLSKSRKSEQSPVWLWLPLTFRNVPKKGEFDVRRLKDSTYFFS